MRSRPLTDQQRNVLGFIEKFSLEQHFPPTLREIGQAIGLTNVNAVRGHLAALEKKGYLTRVPDKARSIQVVRSPSAVSRAKRTLHKVLRTDEDVLHRVVYGLAWTTHGRRPWLVGPAAQAMSEALEREAMEHGWTILDKGIQADHIVVLVLTWPNHSPAQTVRRLQSAGKAVRRRHPTDLPREALWGKGYAVTTDLDLLDELADKLLAGQPAPPDDAGERA